MPFDDEWDRWDDESIRLWTRFGEEDISYVVNSLGSLVVARRCGLWRGKEPGGIITGNPWVVAQSGTLLAACKRLGAVALANSLLPILVRRSYRSIPSIVYARFLMCNG